MLDFIISPQGTAMVIVISLLAFVGYIVISVFEAMITDEYHPMIEEKCKKCICYGMCRNHGCIYDCKDYMTEEMLKSKGMDRHDK